MRGVRSEQLKSDGIKTYSSQNADVCELANLVVKSSGPFLRWIMPGVALILRIKKKTLICDMELNFKLLMLVFLFARRGIMISKRRIRYLVL